jgi:aminoglycoside phosphotransferase (APT) family kinase protein
MKPSELRLLNGARQLVRQLAEQLVDPRQLEYLQIIEVVLGELIQRQDRAFYAQMYVRAVVLASDGRVVTGRAGALPPPPAPELGFDAISAALSVAFERLSELVAPLSASDTDVAQRLLARIVNWEAELHADRSPPPAQASLDPGARKRAVTHDALQDYLSELNLPVGPMKATSIRELPGGYSKQTILFDADTTTEGEKSFVIRAEISPTPFLMDGADIVNEFCTVKAAFEEGLPVAEPMWLEEDANKLGSRFFVSRRAAGSNFGDVMGGRGALSRETIKDLVRVLALIHNARLDPDDAYVGRSHLRRWLGCRTMSETAQAYVDYWAELSRRLDFGLSPAIERGFAWLRGNLPDCDDRPVLVHGDYGLHNVMIDRGKVSAVLDWEAAYVGDPADEFFLFSLALSPYVSRPELLRLYGEAGGRPISRYRLCFYDVLNCLKGPIVGYGALQTLEKHPAANVKVSFIAYRYMALQLRMLNDAIEKAEAARRDGSDLVC